MPMKNLTPEQKRSYTYSAETRCLCQQKFTENNHKCKHHNCLNGEYIDHVCNACNLQLKITGRRRSNKKGGPPAKKTVLSNCVSVDDDDNDDDNDDDDGNDDDDDINDEDNDDAGNDDDSDDDDDNDDERGVVNDEMEFTLPVLAQNMK
jgi:hypothetical protein